MQNRRSKKTLLSSGETTKRKLIRGSKSHRKQCPFSLIFRQSPLQKNVAFTTGGNLIYFAAECQEKNYFKLNFAKYSSISLYLRNLFLKAARKTFFDSEQ